MSTAMARETSVKAKMNERHLTRVMSFTSGKGGVGKSSLVVNTALALAQQGHSVLLLDADLGLANIDVLLGLRPRYTLHELLNGERTLEEIMIPGPFGISIIPAASGIDTVRDLNYEQRMLLMEAVENAAYRFDYLLIDTGAGIGGDVMYFNSASTEIVCVITNEPTSLTDSYALIKVLSRRYGEKSVAVVVNNVANEAETRQAFTRLSKAVSRFLQVELRYLGCVPHDRAAQDAVREQRALVELFPSSPAGLAISNIARTIDGDFWAFKVKGGVQFFFKQLLELNADGGCE